MPDLCVLPSTVQKYIIEDYDCDNNNNYSDRDNNSSVGIVYTPSVVGLYHLTTTTPWVVFVNA